MSVTIEREYAPNVAKLVFSNPPHNHANTTLIGEIADALEELDDDLPTRAIVMVGEGRHFCAGADLTAPDGSGVGSGSSLGDFYEQVVRLFATEKPIVAAVQGAAIGAGLGLALAADFRLAAPRARFAANFTKLGFHPGFGLTETLPGLIGVQRANHMFLSARRFKPETVFSWGLIDGIESEDSLESAATALAREIAENAPLALRSTRKTLRGNIAERVRTALVHELAEQTKLRRTDDFKEGVASVNERRLGDFKGQ